MADNEFNYSDFVGKDDTFDVIIANLKEIQKELIATAKIAKKEFTIAKPSDTEQVNRLAKEVKELVVANKLLDKQLRITIKAKKERKRLTDEELIQAQAEKIDQRERLQRAKQLAIIRKQERNNIKSLRAQLSLVTLDWSKLTEKELQNSKASKELAKRKLDLTNRLKALERATGDNRREVGNYTKATGKLGSTLKRLFVGRTIADGILRLGGALGEVIEKNKDTNAELGKLNQAIEITKNVTEDLAVAFLELVATPLSDFLLNVSFAISKVQDFFKETKESTGVFSVAIDNLTSAFGSFLEPIRLLFVFLSDFPAIIGGTINVFKEFGTVATSTFENVAIRAERAFLEIERGIKSVAGVDVTDLDNRIQRLSNSLAANQAAGAGLFGAYARGYDDVKQQQETFNVLQKQRLKDQEKEAENEKNKSKIISSQNKKLEEQRKIAIEIEKANIARAKAIQELQKKIEETEVGNIKNNQERVLQLEILRFETLQDQRKANFLELQILLKGQDEELKKAEKLNQKLSEEQLIEHESNKIDIRKRFAIKTIEIEALTEESLRAQREKAIDDQLKSIGSSSAILAKQQKDIALENQKAIDDALKTSQDKQKKSTQELLNTISSASKKVSEIVTKLFQEQADLSAKSVQEQEGNLTAARDRAAKGLEANIAFEEKELAARQSEQIKRQKEQEQAAKILTLFNLVGAYAQNGDKNALARGLVDFSLLEALGSGIQGFYEGTENVEQSLGSSAKTFSGIDAYLGVTNSGKMLRFDGKERIFNAAQNMALGYMSNDETVTNALIGAQISDYNNPFNPVNQNLYEDHKEGLKSAVSNTILVNDNSEVVNELRNLNKRIASQPNFSYELEKVYRRLPDLIKTEVRNGFKKITKGKRL